MKGPSWQWDCGAGVWVVYEKCLLTLKWRTRKEGRISDQTLYNLGRRLVFCSPLCCLEECIPLRVAVWLAWHCI